ncbi:hypothetical protein N1851_005165 [Merluccius polli]|uniref:Uncharacterized protein n=1 Tax=Merluccius polli TaxID=89951 RepID=A0AA47N651_MERPO|nr:hypothetical protein N1851_005165 [Merluccius polli]
MHVAEVDMVKGTLQVSRKDEERPEVGDNGVYWGRAIKRVDWNEDIIKNARVCSAHFISGTIGKGGEMTDLVLQQTNVFLLKLQNKNAAWIIVLLKRTSHFQRENDLNLRYCQLQEDYVNLRQEFDTLCGL